VFLPLPGRVAKQLLELDEAGQRSRAPHQRITQTELAQMVGATRQSVNQALRTLEARGLIRMGPQGIKILDHAGLRRRATL
jgi:CRP/FNR family transcriptional regulator